MVRHASRATRRKKTRHSLDASAARTLTITAALPASMPTTTRHGGAPPAASHMPSGCEQHAMKETNPIEHKEQQQTSFAPSIKNSDKSFTSIVGTRETTH